MYRTCAKVMLFLVTGFLIACSGNDGDGEADADTALESTSTADTEESVLIVTDTYPPRGSMGVPRDVQISVSFSEDVDPRTVTDSSIMLMVNDFILPGTITWLENVVTFTPVSPLSPDTTYTMRVTNRVRDLQENPLALDYIWSFTTSSALTPGSPGQLDGRG